MRFHSEMSHYSSKMDRGHSDHVDFKYGLECHIKRKNLNTRTCISLAVRKAINKNKKKYSYWYAVKR